MTVKDGVDARNREIISYIHNKHRGERLFVLGTGPSLDTIPDEWFLRLANEYTIGVNTIVTYSRLRFRLTYYCISEAGWLTDSKQPFNVHRALKEKGMSPSIRFYCHPFSMHNSYAGSMFNDGERSFAEEMEDWVYVKHHTGFSMANHDAFSGLGESFDYVPGTEGSVALFAIQLGCWMGFESIYLLGCDANQEGYSEGLSWEPTEPQRRDQSTFIRAAQVAEKAMEKAGRQLINLAPGGNLTIKRGDIREVLKQ